jgi:hypothetical protein
MFSQVGNGREDEGLSGKTGFRNFFELCGSKTPASNGEQNLQLWISDFEGDNSLVQALFAVGR